MPRLVLLAAGRSSRYGTPKQVAPLGPGGASLTAYTVVDALRAGFEAVVMVTTRELRPVMERHLERTLGPGLPLLWAYQDLHNVPVGLEHLAESRRKPWGTAHAILSAASLLPGPFGVANGDDWYGPKGLAALAATLVSGEAPGEDGSGPCRAVAVGYPMDVTLSPSGGVSRGWIQADGEGTVRRVVELREVRTWSGGRILGVGPDGAPVQVPPGSPASMNLWGFQPCVLPLLEAAFRSFLQDAGSDDASEFALSTAVDDLLAEGVLALRLIPEGRRWFGITHPGDTDAVARRLEDLHRDGTYATPLHKTLD